MLHLIEIVHLLIIDISLIVGGTMSLLRRLYTDIDFQETVDHEKKIRVFQHNQIIDDQAIVLRFDDDKVVTQASVGDITYHSRHQCEFFLLRKR